jgi:hypothetical protein
MVSWTCLKQYDDHNNRNHNTAFPFMSHTIKSNPSASEIDDIFTSNARTVTPKVNPRSALKQKREKKAIKTQLADPKRPAPEIVFDTSAQQPGTSKTTSHDRPVPPRKRQKVVETKLVQDKFRDSRGTGPRKHFSCQCYCLAELNRPRSQNRRRV